MPRTYRPQIGVSLRDTLPGARVFGDAAVHATSCTTVASGAREGDVYFAVDSLAAEASAAAQLAVANGATAVVTDHYLPVFGVPQFVVDDARRAHGEFCHRVMGDPTRSITLAGIAGAHGKTTVSRLLAAALKHAGVRCGVLIDDLESDSVQASEQPAPPAGAARVARWLGECDAAGCEAAVLELSPRAIRNKSHAGARLSVLCVINQNFDRGAGRSPDEERRLAAGLADSLAPFATLVANINDPHCVRLAAERGGLVLTFGLDKPADLRGSVVEHGPGGQVLMVTAGHETACVSLGINGGAFALDCLAAIATAVAMGAPFPQAAHGVESVTRLPAFMHPVACGQPFAVLLDAGASPERVRAALNAARQGCSGRLVVALAENSTMSVRSVATALADLVVCPAAGDHDQSSALTRHVDDRFSAIALALALAEPGDAVLLSGVAKGPAARRGEEALVRQLVELRLSNTREAVTMP